MAIANGTILGTDVPVIAQKLFSAAQPTAKPSSVSQAISWAAGAWGVSDPSASPTPPANIVTNALGLVLNGFTSNDLQAVASGAVSRGLL